MAKKEIVDRGWKYTEHNISDPEFKKELLEKAPDSKTVPQIWIGKNHIGGCSLLKGIKNLMDEKGGEGLAGFGSAKCSNEEAYLFQKFIRQAFGTNNVDHCTTLASPWLGFYHLF